MGTLAPNPLQLLIVGVVIGSMSGYWIAAYQKSSGQTLEYQNMANYAMKARTSLYELRRTQADTVKELEALRAATRTDASRPETADHRLPASPAKSVTPGRPRVHGTALEQLSEHRQRLLHDFLESHEELTADEVKDTADDKDDLDSRKKWAIHNDYWGHLYKNLILYLKTMSGTGKRPGQKSLYHGSVWGLHYQLQNLEMLCRGQCNPGVYSDMVPIEKHWSPKIIMGQVMFDFMFCSHTSLTVFLSWRC